MGMRFFGVAWAVALLLGATEDAQAQFDHLRWDFVSGNGGTGSLTAEVMTVVGPDASTPCAGGDETNFAAVAPYDSTVVFRYSYSSTDAAGFDGPAYSINGAVTALSAACTGCVVSLDLDAGDKLSIGVYSVDCIGGPGVAAFSDFVFAPRLPRAEVNGAYVDEQLGTSIAGGIDLDGDQTPDIAVGAPGAPGGGTVSIFSGINGTLIASLAAFNREDQQGTSVAALSDLDMDGVSELLVGAPGPTASLLGAGSARVYSGATQTLLFTTNGDSFNDQFGASVASFGDLDGDGTGDFLVGSPKHDGGAHDAGMVRVLSGVNGNVLLEGLGSAIGAWLGTSVCCGGDVDADGFPDVVAGAPSFDGPSATDVGQVAVFSGAGGGQHQLIDGIEQGGMLGQAVIGIGDVDADGRDDFAVGAPGAGTLTSAASGRVAVLSGADGSELYAFEAGVIFDQLGRALSSTSDVDGDGHDDLIVGAPWSDGHGRVYLLSGVDGVVRTSVTGAEPGSRFGDALAGVGDVDGSGLPDIAVGAPDASLAVASAGSFSVVEPRVVWSNLGNALAGSFGVPQLEGKGTLAPNANVTLQLSGGAPTTMACIIIGRDRVDKPLLGGVLVPRPDLVLSGFRTGSGDVSIAVPWPASIPSGQALYFQIWIADATGPAGASASNALRAVVP